MVAIAGAAAAESAQGDNLGGALIDLAIGLAVGIVVGLLGGWAMRTARRRGWVSEDFTGPAVLALALALLGTGLCRRAPWRSSAGSGRAVWPRSSSR